MSLLPSPHLSLTLTTPLPHSDHPRTSPQVELAFHGVQAAPSGLALDGAGPPAKLYALAPLRREQVKPQVRSVQPKFKPERSGAGSLGGWQARPACGAARAGCSPPCASTAPAAPPSLPPRHTQAKLDTLRIPLRPTDAELSPMPGARDALPEVPRAGGRGAGPAGGTVEAALRLSALGLGCCTVTKTAARTTVLDCCCHSIITGAGPRDAPPAADLQAVAGGGREGHAHPAHAEPVGGCAPARLLLHWASGGPAQQLWGQRWLQPCSWLAATPPSNPRLCHLSNPRLYAPLSPPHPHPHPRPRSYVYDGELEAQMVMVFDANKQLLKGARWAGLGVQAAARRLRGSSFIQQCALAVPSSGIQLSLPS